jgi:triphosphoribosyl-dephospho-CoA synthase
MAPKPGNVSRGRDLPGLTYRDFLLSATLIGPVFRRRAARGGVGRLILEAIGATRRVVPGNTNLGLVLLLAPLAAAAARPGRGALRRRLRAVLRRLDRRDARDAYRAIRLAAPGGLGRVRAQDLSRPPTRGLLACMRLAARRDAIAREYAGGFRTTFERTLPLLLRLRERHVPASAAIVQTYLGQLAAENDSLIVRRHGAAAARRVRREAGTVWRAGGILTARGRRLAARLDRRLRTARPPLNPGTTADLTAAAIFVWLLEAGGADGEEDGAGRRVAARAGFRTRRSTRRGSSRARPAPAPAGRRRAAARRASPPRARRPPARRASVPRSSARRRRRARP